MGLAYKHQIRYEPGSHAWVWERAWRPGARRFDAGAAGVAIVTTGGGNAPAIIYGSTDGGATWTDGAVLNVSNATSGGSMRGVVGPPDRVLAFGAIPAADRSPVAVESLDGGSAWLAAPVTFSLTGVAAARRLTPRATIASPEPRARSRRRRRAPPS